MTAPGTASFDRRRQPPPTGQGGAIQIVVTNDQLEYHHFNNAVVHAAVAPDGWAIRLSAIYCQSGGSRTLVAEVSCAILCDRGDTLCNDSLNYWHSPI
jgi:hypothetical protein